MEIDLLIFSQFGLFVVETKTPFTRAGRLNQKARKQLERAIKALEAVVGIQRESKGLVRIRPMTVFVRSVDFEGAIPDDAVSVEDFPQVIRSIKHPVLKRKDVAKAIEAVASLNA